MISKKGFWIGKESKSQHYYDASLSKALFNFFINEKITTLADFGCGMGTYVKYFCENGLKVDGFDGNPNTPELTNGKCKIMDLSVSSNFKEKYDWIMSLEVGEHLPKKFEDIFISNLHNNNKYGIVLSWAIKGQGGHGHCNEQNNDYIKDKFSKLGYVNDIKAETKLRKSSSLWWFKNTILCFRKA